MSSQERQSRRRSAASSSSEKARRSGTQWRTRVWVVLRCLLSPSASFCVKHAGPRSSPPACLPACPPPYLQPVAVLEVLDAGDTAAVQVQVRQARQEVRQALVLACTTTTTSSSSARQAPRTQTERGKGSRLVVTTIIIMHHP